MTRYRIVPYRSRSWLVQRRWLWFWIDCTRILVDDYCKPVTFDTMAEAAEWIKEQAA